MIYVLIFLINCKFLFTLCVVYLLSLEIKPDREAYNQHHLQTFILWFHITTLSLNFTMSIETVSTCIHNLLFSTFKGPDKAIFSRPVCQALLNYHYLFKSFALLNTSQQMVPCLLSQLRNVLLCCHSELSPTSPVTVAAQQHETDYVFKDPGTLVTPNPHISLLCCYIRHQGRNLVMHNPRAPSLWMQFTASSHQRTSAT